MLEADLIDIQIQPFKGGGSLTLSEAKMTLSGLETVDGKVLDHSFFAVTEEPGEDGFHHFLTQRTRVNPNDNLHVPGDPKLALIRPRFRDGRYIFDFDGRDSVPIPAYYDPSKIRPVQLWEYMGGAVEVIFLSEWLSDNLGQTVKVVKTVGPWDRQAKQNFEANNNPIRAQDGYPIHIVSAEDARQVFDAIGEKVDPNRFRYQLLLEGLPFREIHNYEEGEINGVTVRQPKPCDRCEVTGIDQETGKFSKIKPLAGLARVGAGRWVRPDSGKRVQIMGENWLPQGEVIIKVGDTFTYTKLRENPLVFA